MSTLVGSKYPKFVSAAAMPNNEIIDLDIESYFQGGKGVILFYPLNFTFVCPSEIVAFSMRIKEFQKLGVKVVAISVDSVHAHLQWRSMPLEQGGIGDVQIPLISDVDHVIVKQYGVQVPGKSIALRATFIVNEAGIIVHESVNDLSVGRSVDEVLRLIEAFIASKSGQVCPANWTAGKALMQPTVRGVKEYLQKMKKLEEGA